MNDAATIPDKPLSRESSRLTEAAPRGAATKLAVQVRLGLCAFVCALAIYQLSETTADPDLFGHVVFGREMLKSGGIQTTEIYSWTARGQPFINHEYGADLILGAAHLALGGMGILLLKLAVGLLTFGLCLRLGSKSLSWPASAVTLVMGLVAIVEISFGFAARPQIFTALCLVWLLAILRRVHHGQPLWALAVPLLFVLWINVHGGVLAGLGLLLLAAGSTTVEAVYRKWRKEPTSGEIPNPNFQVQVFALWLCSLAAIAALFCNPWGAKMVRWLVGSVLWLRPEIEEWNPTPFGWDHASLFILIAVCAFAWAFSRRRRALWELAVTGAFAVLALRSVRNAPLFAVVALALTPPHLSDALLRFKGQFERLLGLWQQERVQVAATIFMFAAAVGIGVGVFTLHKDHPLTMEVPRAQYPTAAIDFIRARHIQGNALVFFDWGDMTIFELPESSPSIDGRLDACYSRACIAEQWKFYNGEPVDQTVLPIDRADFALLPSKLAGVVALRDRPGWKLVYFDNTAAVLVREPQRFAALNELQHAIEGPPDAAVGRAPFPDRFPSARQ